MRVPSGLPTFSPNKPGPSPTRWRRFVEPAAAILAVVLQSILFFGRVLIHPSAHIPFDIEGFHLPLISYIAQCVRQGVAPLWDPYEFCGMPIHADIQAQLFYPFTWVAILFGKHSHGRNLFYWIECMVPLHMALGGLFTLALLRRLKVGWPAALLGASIYQLGGYFASQAQHLGAVCTGAWLPLALLAIFELRRYFHLRWLAILAASIALAILSGFAATAVVIAVAALLFAVALLLTRQASWRLLASFAAAVTMGAAICAVQLIPLWVLTHQSIASLRGNWSTQGGGLPLQALISLVSPDHYHIFEYPHNDSFPFDITFLYAYLGMAALVLLALAPFLRKSRARLFFVLTAICGFWMVGEHTPFYRIFFVHLPGLLRGGIYAEYSQMAFDCFAGIAAAIVLQRFARRSPRALVWCVALFSSYDLIHIGSNRPFNSAPGGYKTEDSENRASGSTELWNNFALA